MLLGDILAGWFMPTECLEGYCRMLQTLITKHGIPENFYSDKHTILRNPNGNLTQFGRICKELGINLIFAETAPAKGKVEKKNDTVQGRLINDIKRKGISTYAELNTFFNNEYINYLNHKFSYKPAEEESDFVPLPKNFNSSNILCIKEPRKVLDGSVICFNNGYYQMIDSKSQVIKPFRGTTVEVMQDIFDGVIRIKYREIVYSTKQIHEYIKKPYLNKSIFNQKELDEYLHSNDYEY